MDEVYNVIEKKGLFEDYSYSIIFDDGFYNNFKFAIPILKKKKLSATFYITTNFVDKNIMSWTDRIEYMIEKTNAKKNLDLYGHKLTFNKDVESKKKFLTKVRRIAKFNKNTNFDALGDMIQKKIKFKKTIKSSNSSKDLKPKDDKISLTSSAIKENKLITFSGVPVNLSLSFLSCVQTPTGHVLE